MVIQPLMELLREHQALYYRFFLKIKKKHFYQENHTLEFNTTLSLLSLIGTSLVNLSKEVASLLMQTHSFLVHVLLL